MENTPSSINAAPPAGAASSRLRAWLAHRYTPRAALALALLLSARSLGFGLRMDDRVLRIFVQGDPRYPGMVAAPHRLFDFATTTAQVEQLRRDGLAAWFADPGCRLTFFRPLSSLLHHAEYRLPGDHPVAMHALSLACFAALVVTAGALYRQLLRADASAVGAASDRRAGASGRDDTGRAAVVGLAVWMFALDHTHGLAIGWVAQRNSLLAALFGALAVLAHDRARRGGDRRAAWLAPVLVLLSLLSAEAGTATVAVLVAHALTLEPRGSRLRALAPYLLPVVGWLVSYLAGGHGVRRSGMYLDVLHAPGAALARALVHYTTLLGTELGNPLVDFWPLAPPGLQLAAVVASVGLLGAFGLAAAPVLRRDRVARFLALAAALALLPSAATMPQTRLLLFASLFQLALLARVAAHWSRSTPAWPRWWRRLALAVTGYAVVGHSLLSPLLLPTTTAQMVGFERALGGLALGLPDDPTRAVRVIVPNAPDLAFSWYIPLLGAAMGRPVPTHLLALANGTRDVELTGLDDHTLQVRSQGGFAFAVTDQLTRSPSAPLTVGDTFDLGDARIEVTRLDERGRADTARVRFVAPLTDPSLVFRRWQGTTLVPMRPPAPGETVAIAAQPFLPLVVAASQGAGPDVPGR